MNTICRFIDQLFNLNQYYDINGQLIKEGDIVESDYRYRGVVKRQGGQLIVDFPLIDVSLQHATIVTRLEVISSRKS